MRDAAGETEGVLLNETVPSWVRDIVVDKNLPKFIKITFHLLQHSSSGAKSLKKYVYLKISKYSSIFAKSSKVIRFDRDRLVANDFIQVRKVAEHVYDKVLGAGSDTGSVAGGGNTVSGGSPAGDRANTDSNADNSSLAEEKVELLCHDQVLDPSMDLRTVRF